MPRRVIKWIQKAIKKPGGLTNWYRRRRKELKKLLGYDPITRRGDIRDRAIPDTIRLVKKGKIRVKSKTLKRLYLAKTLQKIRRR